MKKHEGKKPDFTFNMKEEGIEAICGAGPRERQQQLEVLTLRQTICQLAQYNDHVSLKQFIMQEYNSPRDHPSQLHSLLTMFDLPPMNELLDFCLPEFTPLMIAARKGYKDFVQVILEVGRADINFVDANQCTALHHAVIKNKPVVVEYLVQSGADINVRSIDGNTPLSLAMATKNKKGKKKAKTKMDQIVKCLSAAQENGSTCDSTSGRNSLSEGEVKNQGSGCSDRKNKKLARHTFKEVSGSADAALRDAKNTYYAALKDAKNTYNELQRVVEFVSGKIDSAKLEGAQLEYKKITPLKTQVDNHMENAKMYLGKVRKLQQSGDEHQQNEDEGVCVKNVSKLVDDVETRLKGLQLTVKVRKARQDLKELHVAIYKLKCDCLGLLVRQPLKVKKGCHTIDTLYCHTIDTLYREFLANSKPDESQEDEAKFIMRQLHEHATKLESSCKDFFDKESGLLQFSFINTKYKTKCKSLQTEVKAVQQSLISCQ